MQLSQLMFRELYINPGKSVLLLLEDEQRIKVARNLLSRFRFLNHRIAISSWIVSIDWFVVTAAIRMALNMKLHLQGLVLGAAGCI